MLVKGENYISSLYYKLDFVLMAPLLNFKQTLKGDLHLKSQKRVFNLWLIKPPNFSCSHSLTFWLLALLFVISLKDYQ